MEFSKPDYWSGELFTSPGDLPNPGIEPRSPTLQADSLPAVPQGKSRVNSVYKSKLAFNVKFPRSSQFFCHIPRLGNLLWTLELSQKCKKVFDIIVLQFVDCLLSGSVVGFIGHGSQVYCSQSPCPRGRPMLIHASAGDTQIHKGGSSSVSCGVPES